MLGEEVIDGHTFQNVIFFLKANMYEQNYKV